MSEKLKIVIADDHPIFRSGLRQVLSAHSAISIIAEVGDGADALGAIEGLKPDVAVLDIDMPGMNGLDLIKALHDRHIDVPVVFLAMYNDREMLEKAMDVGARGYVVKESAARELVEALGLVTAGKYYISPAISAFLVDRRERAAG